MVAPAQQGATRMADPAVPAFFALLAGAVAMGASPIFVRFAEVGPFTSAFWRVGLALPALWLWAHLEGRRAGPVAADRGAVLSILLAGFFFAGDLTFWHLAILNTTVANATLLATLAPVWVVLGSGLLGEAVGREVFAGLALCLLGAAALVGASLSVSPEHAVGDFYGLVTSVFFGAYFLAVRRARRVFGSGRTMFYSSLATAALLLVQAGLLEDRYWPSAPTAMAALFALALISHAGGQGLLAFALGHLRAAFSSLVIFIEAVAAAILGWVVLGEAIGPAQAVGAALIFAGVAVARPRSA